MLMEFSRDNAIKVMNQQWNEAMEYLRKHDVTYDDMGALCEEVQFFNRFTNFMEFHMKNNSIDCAAKQIGRLYRVIIETDEQKIGTERFIPKWEFASLNRMNDENKLYHYFATEEKKTSASDIVKTGIAEIRASENDQIWQCKFNIKKEYWNRKVLNLCSKNVNIPMDDIEFSDRLERLCTKDKKNSKGIVERELSNVFLRILELSDMFAPINKDETAEKQRIYYRPFHFIADYFERNGYIGIKYRSTVKDRGVALALFGTEYTEPVEKSINKVDFNTGKVFKTLT